MARPGRGRARPQNLSFSTWRGLGEAGRGHHALELDCDPESEADRGLGNYKTFKRVP